MRPISDQLRPDSGLLPFFCCCLSVYVSLPAALTGVADDPEVGDAGEVLSVYVAPQCIGVRNRLPAYLVVAFTADRPTHYLKINKNRKLAKKIVFAILIFCVSYPFASFMAQWNSAMELPDLMSGIEEVMRSMEDAAMETTELLLSGSTIGSLVLNLLIIAGMAAISEELFFRGALQQFLMEKYRNGHAAVWITALLFSVVHFQFYGFLPGWCWAPCWDTCSFIREISGCP